MTATISIAKGSYFSSEQFNKRFSDLLGGSILKGFYLSKGSGDFGVTVSSGEDDTNVLITSDGIRIEETATKTDAFTVAANPSEMVRIDAVYVHFENTVSNKTYNFAIQRGEPGGELPYFMDNTTNTLIGFVVVPSNGAALEAGSFDHPSRGVKLGKVSGAVDFEDEVNFGGTTQAPDPLVDSDVATKGYVDRKMRDEVPPYIHNDLSVVSKAYDAERFVHLEVDHLRPDGTLYMKSVLSELSPAGNYEQVKIEFFDESGANKVKTEVWELTYDADRNITNKQLL